MIGDREVASKWQARTELLLGEGSLAKLKGSHVLVVGLGGVGACAAEMICRAGVGRMTIVDGDVVEDSNRNRQLPALASTVGMRKAEVVAARLRDVNPEAEITPIAEYLKDRRMEEVLDAAKYSCVLDAIDTLSPKFYLIWLSLERGLKVVSSMGSGARLDPEKVRCADIEESCNCSLARGIRKRLHKRGVRGGFKAVFSPEDEIKGSVIGLEDGVSPNRKSVAGTISYMPAVFGCHCAAAVIRELICQNGG